MSDGLSIAGWELSRAWTCTIMPMRIDEASAPPLRLVHGRRDA